MKKGILALTLVLGISSGANATWSTANTYLQNANTNAGYAHLYLLRSYIFNNVGYRNTAKN